ncbi:phosphate signaling complex protein PhoU [Microvirga sp. W0021]|uniref:Phosphate-specific transport system accessory protein PhoU n=1 Tax=Hohaiivirga grylli TaxID=3133970 RepID=A0ABV0BFZ2_9HYPH
MAEHIVSSYDIELQNLRKSISEMGGKAEQMLDFATLALINADTILANKVIAMDKQLDLLQKDIDEQAIVMIARRQPIAVDLRTAISAIRISNDIERIGDLAKNIAKRSIVIAGQFEEKTIVSGIEHMSNLAQHQLKTVLDAYGQLDARAASEVWLKDDEVDALHNSIFRELLTYMMEDPRNISFCAHLLFCAKNIERIGDHCTNIAETIYYLVTSETMPTERPKSETVNL